ncbi:MAG: SGNH/GDSL hydrolase family protein [Candidatus Eiseniibacteriota bacterium]|jgi:hypothetical protein
MCQGLTATRRGGRRILAGSMLCGLLAIVGLGGGCDLDPPTPPTLDPGRADFTRLVAVGASLTAGMQSGALVEDFQALAFPALIAAQAGQPVGNDGFAYPAIGYPGLGAGDTPGSQAAIRGITALPSPCSPVIEPIDPTPGQPVNLAYQGIYANLGVPGASLAHLTLHPSLLTANPFVALVARPSAFDDRSLAGLAVQAQPTLLLVWPGMGDALVGVTAGDPDAMLSPFEFQSALSTLIDTLVTSDADIVMANLFDVTALPYVTTLPRVLVDPTTCEVVTVGGAPVALLGQTDGGTAGPLPAGTRVTLGARAHLAVGRGIPAAAGGTGEPLPDEVVLTPDEVEAVRERIEEYNTIIAGLANDRELPLVDLDRVIGDLLQNGTEVAGIELDATYVTGGLISLDGLHPTAVGQGLIADAFIATLNAHFGSNLAPIDLAALLAVPGWPAP